jgi:hypothetical protein
MITLVIIGAIAGAVLSIRFRVLALVPAILVATVIVIMLGHHIGQHLGAIALTALATIASLQIGYMLGCVARAKAPPYPAAASPVHWPSVGRKVH